jgi:hypothetical protein
MENIYTFIEIGTQPTKVDAMAIQHTNPSLFIQCHIMNLGVYKNWNLLHILHLLKT